LSPNFEVFSAGTLWASTLVYPIYDSTEVAIQKMIESCERTIDEQHNSSVVNRVFKLKIKTLQNAPRDPDKLQRLLQSKERKKKDQAMHIKDIQTLVTEIEMLKVVLYLVCRNNDDDMRAKTSKNQQH